MDPIDVELTAFETQQERRQKRRCGGQEIVGHDHPLPNRQSLQSNHPLTVRPTGCFISRLSGGALSQEAVPPGLTGEQFSALSLCKTLLALSDGRLSPSEFAEKLPRIDEPSPIETGCCGHSFGSAN
jgi:hypothetical protein